MAKIVAKMFNITSQYNQVKKIANKRWIAKLNIFWKEKHGGQ